MKLKTIMVACLVLAPVLVAVAAEEVPAGWLKAGDHRTEYEVGADAAVHHGGRASGFIKSIATELHGFGTLMQQTAPGQYLGKRVRLSAYVKSEKVQSGWAGLWFRIDGPSQEMLGFDNMQGRPIKGTNDWRRVEIVLDVPDNAAGLAFGVLLAGDGEVWIDDLQFEIVTKDVPVTGAKASAAGPQNLNFEK
jgi:hypothetical protein